MQGTAAAEVTAHAGWSRYDDPMIDDPKRSIVKRPVRFVPMPKVFVLEIDDKPILAFEARSALEARELKNESWLLNDLRRLTSSGLPIWNGKAKLRVGPADGDTADELQATLRNRITPDLPIAYLVPIDGKA